MLIRFGMTSPEDFPGMGEGLEELWRDLAVFTNLSTGTKSSAGEPTEEQPLSWVMVTGDQSLDMSLQMLCKAKCSHP